MSGKALKRKLFLPRLVLDGETRDTVNGRFLAEATALRLQFRCSDCLYGNHTEGTCLLRFPNAGLMREPAAGLDDQGNPVFCKSFEV